MYKDYIQTFQCPRKKKRKNSWFLTTKKYLNNSIKSAKSLLDHLWDKSLS